MVIIEAIIIVVVGQFIGNVNEYYQIIRSLKILLTQTNQLVVISSESIISINLQNLKSISSPILVCDYFNDNDIYQQFELIETVKIMVLVVI